MPIFYIAAASRRPDPASTSRRSFLPRTEEKRGYLAILVWCAVAAFAGSVGACAPNPPSAAAGCAMQPADAQWANGALAAWDFTAREKLKLGRSELPLIILADARCSYRSEMLDAGRIAWRGTAHRGSIRFPDGTTMPIGVFSYSKSLPGTELGYFTMSMPSVWAQGGVTSALGLETLMTGVFLHEMMHAYQFYFANPAFEELTRRYNVSENVGDDSLQEHFQQDPAYVAAYQAERDVLYRAALEPDPTAAKALAREGLRLMRQRRDRWFRGDEASWRMVEDIFLLMEGVGQWAAYAWITDPRGGGVGQEAALPELRRNGRYWTQEEGLAIFLVVDRFLPNWQRHAFAARPETAEALLARAVDE